MRSGVPAVAADEPLPTVLRRLVDEGRKELYVTGADGSLHGTITLAEMSDVLARPEGVAGIRAGDVANRDVPRLLPDDRLSEAIGRWSQVSRDRLPVVDAQGHYLGELSAGDIIFLYSQEVLHKDARLARFDRTGDGGRAETTYVELPREYVVAKVVLSEAFRGTTLRDLDARRRHGINVLEVTRRAASRLERRTVPDADMVLEPGDVLIVVGRPSEIALFRGGPSGPP